MSAIRERTALCVIDLPKKLTSRRNLLAHFSQYGEVKNVSVKKDLRYGVIQFTSHFGAQSAKSQGKIYEDEPLNILWLGSAKLDPRARDKEATPESDSLWQTDDKECFGIESVVTRDDPKQSAKYLIKQHLKVSNLKKRPTSSNNGDNILETKVSQKSPNKSSKVGPKTLISLKKSLLIGVNENKHKLVRRESKNENVENKRKKLSTFLDQSPQLQNSALDRTDLKQKLTALDERDKLIRQETVQDSDIKTAAAIRGTCLDMCPEKERILRQYRHSVALYELIPGTTEMDENKAVKEYSRSSADQEVPLPHDLRPEPVLSMTMNYLISNIINRVDNPDENKAVWYSFCWNRLRSIRKDIILQQLCDMETVKIVEQCARFHICCYDHMWGADVSGFDDKINTRNLIDCLQTLRHMYEDLGKKNVRCSNESEFYSYLILLKLRSGDVMWEYQQYSLEIQLSFHVQFALEAYMAFANNMYSRYFSLVKKASYLTACLMQRYFDEIRTKALKTMLKAYCLPGKAVGLSSSFLVSTLKFDSQKNAQQFCEREEVDIKIEYDENLNDKEVSTSSFLIREKRLPIANAVVGENNLLPVYVPHQVHSSFDEFGKLKDSYSKNVTDNFSLELHHNEDKKTSDINISGINVQLPSFKFSLNSVKEIENVPLKNEFSVPNLPGFKQSEDTSWMSNIPAEDNLQEENTITEVGNVSSYKIGKDYLQCLPQEDNAYHKKVIPQEDKEQRGPEFNQHMFKPVPLINNQCDFTFSEIPVLIKQNSLFKFKENKLPNTFENLPSTTYDSVSATENQFFALPNLKNQEFSTFTSLVSQTKSIKSTSKLFDAKLCNKEVDNILMNASSPEVCSQISIDNSKQLLPSNLHIDLSKHEEYCNKENLEQINQTNTIEVENEKCAIKKDISTLYSAQHFTKLKEGDEEKLKIEENKRRELEMKEKKTEEQKVLQHLKKDLNQRMKVINTKKFARLWKSKVEKLKKSRADFPLLNQLQVNQHSLVWGTIESFPGFSISKRAKDKKDSLSVISRILQSGISSSGDYISSDLAESLASSAAKTMSKGTIKPIYWKLVISVPWVSSPLPEFSVFKQLMKKWCKKSFYRLQNASLGSVESVMTSFEIPVHICVHFSEDLQSGNILQGMDALVFIVLNETELEKNCLQRLRTLVTSQPKGGNLCVSVMNMNGNKYDRVLKKELKKLHEQKFVSHWTLRYWTSFHSIFESLHFLTEHVNVIQDICTSPLELLVNSVSDDFFDSLNAGQHLNNGLMNAVKNPNNVIYLYNICLSKLEDILMSSKLEKYLNLGEEFKISLPSNEFGGLEVMCGKQYDNTYKLQVSNKINSLRLPEFFEWPVKCSEDLLNMLQTYCLKVHSINAFSQIMRMIDIPDDSDLLKHLTNNVSWLNIVEILAQSYIRYAFDSKENKQMLVVFNKTDVQRMVKKQWWLKLPMISHF